MVWSTSRDDDYNEESGADIEWKEEFPLLLSLYLTRLRPKGGACQKLIVDV